MLQTSFGLFIAGFVCFLFYASTLLYSNFSLKKENRSSFLNSYGYEFYSKCNLPIQILLYTFLACTGGLIATAEITFLLAGHISYYTIILAICFSLSFILLIASNVTPLSFPRVHLTITTIAFFVFAFACFIYMFSMTNMFKHLTTGANYNDIIAIFIGVIGVVVIASLFNPRLKNWAKMERSEIDGKIVFIKPKINFLSLYEWIYLLVMILVAFLFFINTILAKSITIKK